MNCNRIQYNHSSRYVCAQDGIQKQVNINPQSQYNIPAGGMANLSELFATTKITVGGLYTGIHQLCLCTAILVQK